ncbi:ribosome maturation factor RimM [Beijerinckia sp. L45]|uniref:ribosome maturation factor RimM n=1 Tax=Beijerinckia sp. L45 TaxID=1641855 RepID=UPI00131DF842|nr:ribosome maturation factor RimM [Beijerinckia sp. L45]
MERILVGRFGAPHGVRGEVRLQSFTQAPGDIGTYGALVDKAGTQRYEIKTLRPVKDNLFVARVAGIADRTAAETLTNIELFVPRAALPPPDEEEFYLIDLIGMAAVDEAGTAIGTVVAVPNYGAGDILEVAPVAGGETLLLPFTKAVVPTVDVSARRVTVVFPDETVDPAEER